MQSFLYLHNLLRYFVLAFTLVVVIQSLAGMLGKKKVSSVNKQMALVMLICCDLQLLLGLFLYYSKGWLSQLTAGGNIMADTYRRFWAVEHSVGMILAIIFIHMGYSTLKRKMDDDVKLKRLFWFTFVALIIFVVCIPWPSRPVIGRPYIPSMH